MTKTIYEVQRDLITELNFICDFPGETETSIWKCPDGTLIKIQNEKFQLLKHIYFEEKNDAMEQVIKWHKDRITIIQHKLKQAK